MQLTGMLDHSRTVRSHNPLKFSQGRGHISQMMHHPHHGQGIKQVVHKRQPVDIGHYKNEAVILPQTFPGLFKLGPGVVG